MRFVVTEVLTWKEEKGEMKGEKKREREREKGTQAVKRKRFEDRRVREFLTSDAIVQAFPTGCTSVFPDEKYLHNRGYDDGLRGPPRALLFPYSFPPPF